MLNGTTTRSPGLTCSTAPPTSSTIPIGSCPRMSSSCMYGARTSYRCRSEPQMAVDVTLMTTSVGSSIFGSGISLTWTSRLPCQVTAFMTFPSPRAVRTRPYPHVFGACARRRAVESHLARIVQGCSERRVLGGQGRLLVVRVHPRGVRQPPEYVPRQHLRLSAD